MRVLRGAVVEERTNTRSDAEIVSHTVPRTEIITVLDVSLLL